MNPEEKKEKKPSTKNQIRSLTEYIDRKHREMAEKTDRLMERANSQRRVLR